MSLPRIYLAGPMIFEADPDRYFSVMKSICRTYGMEGVGPLDNQLHLDGATSGRALNLSIYQADCGLMESCDAALFCLDGFRQTPEMDPGTAFEVGYMRALKKPMSAWTQMPESYPEKVAAYSLSVWGEPLTEDTLLAAHKGAKSGLLRDRDGVMVHSAGCVQNLMIEMAVESSGAHVHANRDWRIAFEAATMELSGIIGVSAPAFKAN